MEQYFEWDNEKADSNYRKHGIRFEEAAQVFNDPFAILTQDRVETGEIRWQAIGMVCGCLLLLVAHTVRLTADNTEFIRIISARCANRKERKYYEHG